MKALKLTQIKSHGLRYDFWRYQLWEYDLVKACKRPSNLSPRLLRNNFCNGRILRHVRTWHEASKLFNELAPQYPVTDFEIVPVAG
jgi:hypothetical protein